VVGRILPSEISEQRFGRMILAFVVIGFLSLLVAGGGAAVIMGLSEDRNVWVSHTYEVESHIDGLRFHLERLASARRGYLLGDDAKFRAAYAASSAAIPAEIDALQRLTVDNPRQQPAPSSRPADRCARRLDGRRRGGGTGPRRPGLRHGR